MSPIFQVFTRPRMALLLLLGFSSGLPLALTGSVLQAWMKGENIDKATVTALLSIIAIPYTLKFLWAPLMDRYVPPFLGRRRGWMLVWQVALALALCAVSFFQPGRELTLVTGVAMLVAFTSASQDIVVDAYRTESLEPEQFGAGASVHIAGYRVAMLVSGSLSLILADRMPWSAVYRIMACGILLGVLATLLGEEPPRAEAVAPRSLRQAVIEPLRDYWKRSGALEMLAFIVLYKLGDNVAGATTTTFYLELGFTRTQIGALAKVVGMSTTIVGAALGGGLLVRLGLKRALWFFGVLQAVSTAGFWLLARTGPSLRVLGCVIGFENFTSGMGTAAYSALLMSLCNRRFTATQYALLTSLMALVAQAAGAPSGKLATVLGWQRFFLFCVLAATPGLLMLLRYDRWTTGTDERDAIAGALEAEEA